MLSGKLKDDTSPLHEELESKMFSHEIMAGSLTREQYITLLQIQYEVIAPFEHRWNSVIADNAGLLIQWKNRNKTEAIESDLNHLSASISEVDLSLFGNMTFDELLGAAYVIEGSTLGGKIISKKLESNKYIQENSTTYFNLYGNTTGEKWKSFLTILNSQSQDHEATIMGAQKTFRFFIKAAGKSY